MLDKRLLALVDNIGRYIAAIVFFQWAALLCSIISTIVFCSFINYCFFYNGFELSHMIVIAAAVFVTAVLKAFCTKRSVLTATKLSQSAKQTLRMKIFSHLAMLGSSYNQHISTAEAVQVSAEGIDQLESYFGAYLPQLFYAVIAPITLFAVIACFNIKAAAVLLICVPLIPLSIIAVQKIAKKLLSKYWTAYTDLGDGFLENIQGLTTLKIYEADDVKHKDMNNKAELFRKATMRVLVMQLNSISVMDIVAYGGAAAGIITMLVCMIHGEISFFEGMIIVLLSAEFFIPMRQLGSFFHVSMNGAAAADKIFKILDIEIPKEKTVCDIDNTNITIKNMSFAYEGDNTVLENVNIAVNNCGLYSFAGKSGCGKSTLAALLTGKLDNYKGEIFIGSTDIKGIPESVLMNTVTLIKHNSYIFKGSVESNLRMGKESAAEKEMKSALELANLAELSLDLPILEQGSNLSGGQRQRLALARALLHDTPIYIFDEATSNIDAESEEAIMNCVKELAKTRLVILISHRLANVVSSDKIFVMNNGRICEEGTHSELMANGGLYSKLYNTQLAFEKYGKEDFGNEN